MHFVGSTQANPYACTAAAIAAPSGPLHGDAASTRAATRARQGLAPALLRGTRRLGAARRSAARAGDGIGACPLKSAPRTRCSSAELAWKTVSSATPLTLAPVGPPYPGGQTQSGDPSGDGDRWRHQKSRHTGEGRCPWQNWIPAFAGNTRRVRGVLNHLNACGIGPRCIFEAVWRRYRICRAAHAE